MQKVAENEFVRIDLGMNILELNKTSITPYIKHFDRMDDGRIPKDAMVYRPKGRKSNGRPRTQLWKPFKTGIGKLPKPVMVWKK